MASRRSARRRARQLDARRQRLEDIGVERSARLARGIIRTITEIAREGRDPSDRVAVEVVEGLEPVLTEAMVASHLFGRLSMIQKAASVLGPRAVGLQETYEDAIRLMERRQKLTEDQIQDLRSKYGEEALTAARGLGSSVQRKVAVAVTEAVRTGSIQREGVRAIRRAFDKAGFVPERIGQPHLAETLFRTNVQLAHSAGRVNASRDPVIDEIFWGWEYTTVGDDRVRPNHMMLDGVRAEKGSARWREIMPPSGFNCRCLLPSTQVQGAFTAGSKAWYSGQAVEITTGQGRRLTVTPNHPVLAHHGWIAAGDITEGCDLVCSGLEVDRLGFRRIDEQNAPAMIEQVFRSLPRDAALARHPRPLDFHGDAERFKGDVDLVASESVLLRGVDPSMLDRLRKFVLEPGRTSSPVGGSNLLANSFFARLLNALPFQRFGLRSVTRRLAMLGQNAGYTTASNSHFPSDLVHGIAAMMSLADCLRVSSADVLDPFGARVNALFIQESKRRVDCDAESSANGGGVVRSPVFRDHLFGILSQLQYMGFFADNAGLFEPTVSRTGADAHGLGDGSDGHARFIELDRVRSVKRFPYAGHVYDLQSVNGWFFADGIAAKNCSAIEIFKEDPEASEVLPPEPREINGKLVRPGPDRGWDFNPGDLFRDVARVSGR